MGMYDYILCDYPLEGVSEEQQASIAFQTKDLENFLYTYTITRDGRLTGGDGGDGCESFTGKVNFYWSNIVSSSHGHYFTHSGEDAWHLAFEATFEKGRVTNMVCVDNYKEPCLSLKADFSERFEMPTPEEIETCKRREAESLKGRTMWVQYGSLGEPRPYPALVIAETAKHYVLDGGDENWGNPITMFRTDRDRLLFDSEADAREYTKRKDEAFRIQKQKYDKALAEKVAERNATN